jgi:hypothetical protein
VNNTKPTTPFEKFRKPSMARASNTKICIRDLNFFNRELPPSDFGFLYLMDKHILVIVVPRK